eukprot:5614745-Amphidinium_carterae.2
MFDKRLPCDKNWPMPMFCLVGGCCCTDPSPEDREAWSPASFNLNAVATSLLLASQDNFEAMESHWLNLLTTVGRILWHEASERGQNMYYVIGATTWGVVTIPCAASKGQQHVYVDFPEKPDWE